MYSEIMNALMVLLLTLLLSSYSSQAQEISSFPTGVSMTRGFEVHANATVTHRDTQLMWMLIDSAASGLGRYGDGRLNWDESVQWCEHANFGGYRDWRLPSVTELQSIINVDRTLDDVGVSAIEAVFVTQALVVEGRGGIDEWPYYWSVTNDSDDVMDGLFAVYVAFEDEVVYVEYPPESGQYELLFIHPAGSLSSVPKRESDWIKVSVTGGLSDQGEALTPERSLNLARCVRNDHTATIQRWAVAEGK